VNDLLFLAYIGTIVVFAISVVLVAVRGNVLFPRNQLRFLLAYFGSWGVAIGVLLASEWNSPYNANFHLDPFWFLIYIGLIGCAMFVAFLLVIEMHYRHVPNLPWIGGAVFVVILAGLSLSAFTLSNSSATAYPWGFYLAGECAMGLGVAAFMLLATKSFQDSANSGQISGEQQLGFLTIGIMALLMVIGLIIYALVFPFMDFSAPFNPSLTVWWLYWVGGASIAMLVVIQRTYEMVIHR
jgi:hypothetical protein